MKYEVSNSVVDLVGFLFNLFSVMDTNQCCSQATTDATFAIKLNSCQVSAWLLRGLFKKFQVGMSSQPHVILIPDHLHSLRLPPSDLPSPPLPQAIDFPSTRHEQPLARETGYVGFPFHRFHLPCLLSWSNSSVPGSDYL